MRRLYYLACLFVPLSFGSTVAAQGADEETFVYVVVEGESCPSIAERVYGDRRRYDVVHAYNEDLGPLPHHLSPGQRLTLPVVSVRRDGPDAEVTNLRPDVQGRPGERGSWREMHLGHDLDRGWRVNTLDEAFAELTFRDESQVTLRENTVVVVLGSSASSTRRSASEARLDRGSLRARLSELRGRRLRVSTPSARAELEGGAAVVSVDESETSRVSNHTGRAVRVSTPDGQGQVRVAPGMGSRVARGAPPTPPRPLPAAPAWVGSQPARWVGVHQRTTVRGAWTAVDTARVYRVEISRSAGGAGLVAAVEVPSEITRFEVHGLPPGSYYARVSTIGRDFFESVPSASYAFEIVLGQLHGPGQEVPQRMDPGDPGAHLRPLTLLPGSVFAAPDGMRCGLAGDPAETLTLVDGQGGDLHCVDADGQPAGGVEMSVQPAVVATESGPARVELVAGLPRTLRLRLRSDADLPRSLLARSTDVTVQQSAWDGEVLTLTLQADAPGAGSLELVHTPDARTALGVVEVLVSDTAQEPPPEPRGAPPPPAPPPRALHESLARALLSSSVGVRDLDRRGVSASASLDYHAESDAALGDRLRTSVNASGDLFEDHLRLSAGAALDLYGRYDRTAHRGGGDLFAAAGYLPRLDELSLLFEVGAFLPTQRGAVGLNAVRLVPTIELSGRVADDRLALRTRQSALVDLSDSGNATWASSYAADVFIIGPWSAGAELALTLGQQDGGLFLAPLAAIATWVDLGPVALEVAGRLALGDEAASAFGPASLIVSIRGGDQPWRPEVGW